MADLTLEEKNELLLNALKQMLGTFDTPIARRRMPDEWSEASRKYAADIYEQVAGHRHQEG